ncbi:MAG: mannose-6-phosphate isomerase, class I [Lachnospiraceae bacterium]|nr:mannose-6-phosphate isomerase, class I [Lachnospiraceae bacterium]
MLQPQHEILFFESEIKNLVWGNENWTISAHNHGDVKVKEGSYAGMTLSQLWAGFPELFGQHKNGNAIFLDGKKQQCESFPLLVKIITANEDLSIQVHPDDYYANENENGSLGKTECWYILDCADDARLVLGHNAKDWAELKQMIDNGRFTELIREMPIKPGDFIQMNPGTIHAIKGGIKLLEIQQSSNITYRLYDYGRTVDGESRPLHLSQALDVIICPAPSADESIVPAGERPLNQFYQLISCDYYTVWELPVYGTVTVNQDFPFLIVCVITGSGEINGKSIQTGDHFILPFGFGEVNFSGEMRLVLAAV